MQALAYDLVLSRLTKGLRSDKEVVMTADRL